MFFLIINIKNLKRNIFVITQDAIELYSGAVYRLCIIMNIEYTEYKSEL